MTEIKIAIDTSQVDRTLSKLERKLPYIVNDSITEVAKLVVSAERFELRRDFTVRKTFLENRFQILEYSRATTLRAVVGVNANVQGSPLLLGFFEEGGEKLPSRGPELAVPITGQPERPTFGSPIATSLQYKRLQISGGKGRKQTFVIPGVGVFQRVAPGGRVWDPATRRMKTLNQSETQILYAFRSRAPLRQRTHMIELAETIVHDAFPRIFQKNFVESMMR